MYAHTSGNTLAVSHQTRNLACVQLMFEFEEHIEPPPPLLLYAPLHWAETNRKTCPYWKVRVGCAVELRTLLGEIIARPFGRTASAAAAAIEVPGLVVQKLLSFRHQTSFSVHFSINCCQYYRTAANWYFVVCVLFSASIPMLPT